MMDLGPEWLTIILFGSLVVLLLAGLPLVFAIGGVATFFIIVLWGPHALPILANRTYMSMDMFLYIEHVHFKYFFFYKGNMAILDIFSLHFGHFSHLMVPSF